MTTNNRQFIKLTLINSGNPLILATADIRSVTLYKKIAVGDEGTRVHVGDGDMGWIVKETPEQIYAMLEPYQPAALLDEYEKLANIATNVKFRLTKTLCKHIPSHIKVNAAALADDIESVCKEITDLGADAKRKANN